MTVLGIDTATETLSVAVVRDGACLGEKFIRMKNIHDRLLSVLATSLLEELELNPASAGLSSRDFGHNITKNVHVGATVGNGKDGARKARIDERAQPGRRPGGPGAFGLAATVASVRFETAPGRQMQVDFGEKKLRIGGEVVRVYLLVAVLSHSRRLFVKPFLNQRG